MPTTGHAIHTEHMVFAVFLRGCASGADPDKIVDVAKELMLAARAWHHVEMDTADGEERRTAIERRMKLLLTTFGLRLTFTVFYGYERTPAAQRGLQVVPVPL